MFVKKLLGTVATLGVGGLVGVVVERKRRNEVNAAGVDRPNQIMRYGFPTNSNLKVRSNYVLSYDRRNRNPNWVFEHLNIDIIKKTKDSIERDQLAFTEDSSIPGWFRSTNRDFAKSGFDRGHMAAAANHNAQATWKADTFYLSNIVPQHPHMNQHAWNNLEKYVRSLCHHNDNVYVCTGPLYLPRKEADGRMFVTYQVIGDNHVAVPTHLFKVILTEKKGRYTLRSYMMPNHYIDPSIPLEQFKCSLENIERAAGFFVFPQLKAEIH
uniref:Endonuclease n=1 Tax=Ciona intestinalis TaxID=7719 RepID=F6TZK8_CIOIN|nr:endonuclease G, mitochondrial-like [Ciona intestinalis]|eukprot:XP_009859536.1 endonuclease G, mitochondrial-like [Ciona intestinalis]